MPYDTIIAKLQRILEQNKYRTHDWDEGYKEGVKDALELLRESNKHIDVV